MNEMTTSTTSDRLAAARARGLAIAAKLAAVSGIAIAAVALGEARAAASSSAADHESAAARDHADAAERAEVVMKAARGGCGCAPCWGPPAPPARGFHREAA